MKLYTNRPQQFIKAIKYTDVFTDEIRDMNFRELPKAEGVCEVCGQPLNKHLYHGSLNALVCPNNYIIFREYGLFQIMSERNFEALYIPICSDDITEAISINKEDAQQESVEAEVEEIE